MPYQLHCVVQHPTDHNQAGLQAVDKKVTWLADDPNTWIHVLPAQSQMPRSNTCAEFGPRETAGSFGLACHVAQRGDDQSLVAQSGDLTDLLSRVRQQCPPSSAAASLYP